MTWMNFLAGICCGLGVGLTLAGFYAGAEIEAPKMEAQAQTEAERELVFPPETPMTPEEMHAMNEELGRIWKKWGGCGK